MTSQPIRLRLKLLILTGCAMIGASVVLSALLGNANPRLAISQSLSAATGNDYSLGAPVILSTNPRIILQSGSVSIRVPAASRWQHAGTALSALVQGRANLALNDAVIAFEPRLPDVSPSIDISSLQSPLLDAFHSTSFQSLRIEKAKIVRLRPGADPEPLGVMNVDITPVAKSLQIKGTFERNGEVLNADATLSNPNLRRKDSPLALTGTLTSPLCDIRVQGRLLRGNEVTISADKSAVHISSLKGLAKWLGIETYVSPGPEVFHAEGRSDWVHNAVTFENTRFTIDGNRAEGSLSANLEKGRPSFDATLDFSNFEISPYLSEAPNTTLEASSVSELFNHTLALWPADALNPVARIIDADIRVSLNNVTRKGEVIGKGAATASIKGGRINLGITGVELTTGGEGEGQISADLMQSPPLYSLSGEMRGVDMTVLGTSLVSHIPASGVGTLVLDVSGRGETESEIVATLSGSMRAELTQNAKIGVDIAAILAQAKLGASKGWKTFLATPTPVDTLTLDVVAANGTFTTRSVEAMTRSERIIVAGIVDISRQMLDIEISRILTTPEDKQPPDANSTYSVRIKGPLVEPDIGSAGLGNRS